MTTLTRPVRQPRLAVHVIGKLPGQRLLLTDVQAHSVQDGPIGGNPLLDEGGQLLFLHKVGH